MENHMNIYYFLMLHAKSLHNIFYKIDGYIRRYDRANYEGLLDPDERYEKMFDWIRYLILLKSNISGVFSHKHTKIKICDDLLLGKALNVLMLIKHLLYKNHNHYYYHMFLGKCIYKYYVNDIF